MKNDSPIRPWNEIYKSVKFNDGIRLIYKKKNDFAKTSKNFAYIEFKLKISSK